MSSFFGYIVGLLQAALSLVGFVQAHPELPPVQKEQAQQVAQQAITRATQALKTSPTNSTPAQNSVTVNGENGYSGTFSATPASGDAPLTVHFSTTIQHAGDETINFGDGSYCSTANPDGSQNCSLYTHIYQKSGSYAVLLSRMMPSTVIARLTVNVGQGSNSPISIPGMSKYTDTDFGFSFWYPSGWKISESTTMMGDFVFNGSLVKKLHILAAADSDITVAMIHTNDSSITDVSGLDGQLTYSFDPGTHTWMSTRAGTNPTPANVSMNTMGGLHILRGAARFERDTIIPLSAHNFVVVEGRGSYDFKPDQSYLVNTIVATDPSVATPVSAAEQTATIQAEKSAYAQ